MKQETTEVERQLTLSEKDELLNWYEVLEERESGIKDEVAKAKAKIGAALRAEFGELHPGNYTLKGDAYTLEVEVGETWSWDSELLLELAEIHPNPHLKVSAKVDREKFYALPPETQAQYHQALTVKTGRLKYTLVGGE